MPTLVLSQRYSTDSDAMWRAALHRGWDVERIRGFAFDPALADRDPVLYGETLLADALMDALRIALLEPTKGWLPALPSVYRRREGDAWPAEPGDVEEVTAFAAAMLSDPEVALPAAVVVDVGRIRDRGWAVVEANAAWASGLCGASPLSVTDVSPEGRASRPDVLRRATVPRDRVIAADLPWIRPSQQ